MNDSKAVLLRASRVRGPRCRLPDLRGSRSCKRVLPGVLAGVLALALTSCGSDFHISASNLEIAPSPAVPGDVVTALFVLRLLPTQRHTIFVVIDDTEHLRVTSDEPPAIPVILEVGDATDLIATYGTGDHTIYVQVRAHEADETARTQTTSFRLNEASPQEEPCLACSSLPSR